MPRHGRRRNQEKRFQTFLGSHLAQDNHEFSDFLPLLITVARKLPKTERFTLLYASGRLYFDRLSIDATPATGMVPVKDAWLGTTPASAARPQLFGAPVAGWDGQLLGQ